MKESLSDRIIHRVIIVVLAVCSIVMILPLYYVVVVAFTDATYYNQMKGVVFLPIHPSLEAFKYLFSTRTIMDSFKISIFLAVIGTILSLIINCSFSYAVSRKRLKGRRILMLGVLITMIFNPGIIPAYLVVKNFGLIDSIWSMILPVLTTGWYVILMRGFFESIPQSLEEAALIDGCNDITIWVKIILPLSMPSIAAFSLFYAVGYWNSYIIPMLYINKHALWPLQVIVRNLIDVSSAVSSSSANAEMTTALPSEMLKMAAVVVAVVPILMVYPFLQKHFTQGATMGSVKE